MARAGVTFEQVNAAADALLAQGVQPTIKAVRGHLRTGSPNTIHAHLKRWRAVHQPSKASTVALPESLMSAIATEIDRVAMAARQEADMRLQRMQAELDELAAASALTETENESLSTRAAALASERDRLVGKVEQQAQSEAAEITRWRTALESSTNRIVAVEQQAAVALAKLEAMTERAVRAEELAQKALLELDVARQETIQARERAANAEGQLKARA